jgi:hypothetical protein
MLSQQIASLLLGSRNFSHLSLADISGGFGFKRGGIERQLSRHRVCETQLPRPGLAHRVDFRPHLHSSERKSASAASYKGACGELTEGLMRRRMAAKYRKRTGLCSPTTPVASDPYGLADICGSEDVMPPSDGTPLEPPVFCWPLLPTG